MKSTKLPVARSLDGTGGNLHANPAAAVRQFSFALLWRGILKQCPQCGVGHAVVPLMILLGRDATISPWIAILILALVTLVGVYFVSRIFYVKM